MWLAALIAGDIIRIEAVLWNQCLFNFACKWYFVAKGSFIEVFDTDTWIQEYWEVGKEELQTFVDQFSSDHL